MVGSWLKVWGWGLPRYGHAEDVVLYVYRHRSEEEAAVPGLAAEVHCLRESR